jgi:hypothetical protein
LAKLTFSDVDHVRAVCGAALSLLRSLPLSLRQLLGSVCGGGAPASATLQAALEAQLCVRIPVWELLAGSGLKVVGLPPAFAAGATGGGGGGGGASSGDGAPLEGGDGWRLLALEEAGWAAAPRYIMLDLRSGAELERGGRLPTGFHVDPAWLGPAGDAEKLHSLLEGFSGLRASGVHFSVCGRGDLNSWYHAPFPPPEAAAAASPRSGGGASDNEDAEALLLLEKEEDEAGRALALLLIQKGFPRVSHSVGGFTALHQCQAHYLADVLVGHDPRLCLVCTGGHSQGALAALEAGAPGAAGRKPPAKETLNSTLNAASNWLEAQMTRLLLSPSEEHGGGGSGGGGGGGGGGGSRRSPSPPPTPTQSLADFLKAPPMHPGAGYPAAAFHATATGASGRGGRAPSESNALDEELDNVGTKRGGGFSGFKAAVGNAIRSPPPRLRALSSSLLQSLDSALSPPPPGRKTPPPTRR